MKGLISFSQEFLYAVKSNKSYDSYTSELKELSTIKLLEDLPDDASKTVFWVNIYNAFIQILIPKEESLFKKSKTKFFSSKLISIANKELSFNDIEHGFLRRSKWVYGLGYINKFFVDDFEKAVRINQLDCRIHFALNCGAKSCPPIKFYSLEDIDAELAIAEENFLTNESEWHKEKNIVKVSSIFLAYYGDFRGKKNILNRLKYLKIIDSDAEPKIRFKKYDWSITLHNYA